jgi:hypothetical protein
MATATVGVAVEKLERHPLYCLVALMETLDVGFKPRE